MALRSYIHTSFDPRRIPGLHSWWDAADSASVTLDSGRVSQLSDKSGNARHLTNTTSGSTQPSYVTAGRNGLNVARFAAASVQRLSVPSSTATYKFLHDGTLCYWIAVSSYGDSSDPNALLMLFATNSGASAQIGIFYGFEDRTVASANNAFNFSVLRGQSGTYAAAWDPSPAWPNNVITPQATTVQEMLMDCGSATAASRVSVRFNGGSTLANNTYSAAVSSANSSGNFTLGATSSNTTPMTGDVCELMFFNQQPTAAARDLIRRYLGNKWGVTVA